MPKLRTFLLIPAVCAALLFLNVSGLAQKYVNISRSPGWKSDCPRMTIDPAGNIHAVWGEFYSMSSAPAPLPTAGDAFYSKYDIASRQWSTPINLSNSRLVFSAEEYVCAIDSDAAGRVYVVYANNTRCMLRILSGGAWSAPLQVGANETGIDFPRVAVTPGGDVFTSWWEFSAGTCWSRARIGGVWENVIQINRPGARSKYPDIAVGPNMIYCTWMEKHFIPDSYTVVFSTRGLTSGAEWSTPQRVSSFPGEEQHPAVKVDASGTAHVVYTPYVAEDGSRIVRYVFGGTGGWSAPRDLSGARLQHYVSLYEIGTNLFTVWQTLQGVAYNDRIDGNWTGETLLPGTEELLFLTDVAVSNDQREIYYLWENGRGMGTEILFSGPLSPPTIGGNFTPIASFSYSPASPIFPADVSFDGSASSDRDGTIAEYEWDFGDGGGGTGKTITHRFSTFGTFMVKLTVTDDKGATGSMIQAVQILRLFQPLNIQVETKTDESLFQVRYLNIVSWQKNPANDDIGATITAYRVYRKKKTEADSAYAAIGDVSGSTFTYTDKTVKTKAEKDIYTYTVTSLNSEGKESPIVGSSAGLSRAPVRSTLLRKGRLKG